MPIKVTKAYKTAIAERNPEQFEAINSIQGPVLVIAGPGTGKTDVLTLRIGNILLQTDTAPQNILCMTYTEAGASEMRSRLMRYIGTEANQVRIQTFHGFCNSVIQEHIQQFSETMDLKPASELERIEIAIEIIDEFEGDNPLKRRIGDIHYDRKPMLRLYELMKQEGWPPEYVHEKIDEWLEAIKDHPDYQYKRATKGFVKGDRNETKYQDELERIEKLRAGVDTFYEYEKKLAKLGLYDFADMLIWVHRKFEENVDLLLDYQERFQYVLVDEFQDTNGMQLGILKQLANYEQPNIFVVGDDDQAIFRFQGALVKNIPDFQKDFNPVVIKLRENYRSSAKIINAATSVINYNTFEKILMGADLEKERIAAGKYADFDDEPRVLEFHHPDKEMAFLIKELDELHKSGILEKESQAVIYRRHAQAENLIKALHYHEIPYHVVRQSDILKQPICNNLLNILGYVDDQYLNKSKGDERLFSIMHYRYFGIDPRDIAKLAEACRYVTRDKAVVSYRKALRDVIRSRKFLASLELNDVGAVRRFAKIIDGLCGNIHDHTLPSFFDYVLQQTGALGWALNQQERHWNLLLITTLFDHIKDLSERAADYTLSNYLDVIERHRTNYVAIPVKSVIEKKNGIHLITAHNAKGREFDRVWILSATKRDWESYPAGGQDQYRLPGNLVAQSKQRTVEDDRRLFFVAMTRTRKNLTVSYALQSQTGRVAEASSFVNELVIPEENPSVQHIHVDEETEFKYYRAILDKRVELHELIEHDVVDRALESYRLSASDINRYMECPRAYYFEKMLRVPQVQRIYLVFGNVVHKALERLFEENWGTLFLNGERLLELFEEEMENSRAKMTERDFEDKMIHGKDILTEYAKMFENTWHDPKEVQTEYNPANVMHRGVPIKGFLDKVEITENGVSIIDYKTGRHDYAKFRSAKPEKDEKGGNSWRQILFYKILLEEDNGQNWNVTKGIMDFVDTRRNKKITRKEVEFYPNHLQLVSDQVVETYAKIRAHEFSEGCNEPRCQWCALVNSELSDEEE